MRPTHILWATHNPTHWEKQFAGTLEECKQEMNEISPDSICYEIHVNEVKQSWNNPVEKTHFDWYMDDSIEVRPMTLEELESENL